jgi:hypothetical protein
MLADEERHKDQRQDAEEAETAEMTELRQTELGEMGHMQSEERRHSGCHPFGGIGLFLVIF